jgi:hypothetical protein
MDRPAQEVHIGSACIPNISRFGRKVRYAGAAFGAVVALTGAAQVIVMRQVVGNLLAPGLCLLAAALLFFQAREKT